MNPIATTCMEMSCEIPNNEHAIGIKSRDPPAIPEAPQAARTVIMHNITVVGKLIAMPIEWQVASVIIVMVIAAPSILIVEPKGILIP